MQTAVNAFTNRRSRAYPPDTQRCPAGYEAIDVPCFEKNRNMRRKLILINGLSTHPASAKWRTYVKPLSLLWHRFRAIQVKALTDHASADVADHRQGRQRDISGSKRFQADDGKKSVTRVKESKTGFRRTARCSDRSGTESAIHSFFETMKESSLQSFTDRMNGISQPAKRNFTLRTVALSTHYIPDFPSLH